MAKAAIKRTIVKSNSELSEAVEEFREAAAMERLAHETKESAKAKILDYLTENDLVKVEVGRSLLTLTVFEVERFDLKTFKVDHPELVNPYVTRSEQKRLTVADA